MSLPKDLLKRLQKDWDPETLAKFQNSFEESIHSIRINPNKQLDLDKFLIDAPVPWASKGYYLKNRPGFTWDPAFQSGAYYVQEAGSMAIEPILKQWRKNYSIENLVGLDACASPGGKSTHMLSLLDAKNDVLVCNEPIKKRRNVLIENLAKWGACNTLVDHKNIEEELYPPQLFDFILVDAPCSGEGLIRRDISTAEEWSEDNVRHCAIRQKNILKNLSQSIKPGGLLIYSTCTYNHLENEDQVKMLLENGFSLLEDAPVLQAYKTKAELGYRFIPGTTKTEGFYVAGLIKENGEYTASNQKKIKKPQSLDIVDFIPENGFSLIHYHGDINLVSDQAFELWNSHLNDLFPGAQVAYEKAGNWLPFSSAGWMNKALALKYPTVDLAWEECQQFLLGNAVNNSSSMKKGLVKLVFEGYCLGFGKIAGRRINNIREKKFRIKTPCKFESLTELRIKS